MNSRVVIERTADRLKLPVELVEKNYYAFWKEIKRELDDPTNLVLVIPFIGKFEISRIRIEKAIKYVQHKIYSIKNYKNNKRVIDIDEGLQKSLENLNKLYDEKFGNTNNA